MDVVVRLVGAIVVCAVFLGGVSLIVGAPIWLWRHR